MYARLIIEKSAKINGRTDRFGTGDWGSPMVLDWAHRGDWPELCSAPTQRASKRGALAREVKIHVGESESAN